jgi:CspA family cold shock protein
VLEFTPREIEHSAASEIVEPCGFSMPVGTVKFFDVNKGFGFIIPDGGGKDVFVHISAVERSGMGTLSQGQRVH